MARFIEADVIQKIATEAEWLTQTRVPYKGQVMIVSDNTGKVVNMKVGDGVNPFADLNYMFDSIQHNASFVPTIGNTLPTPSVSPAFTILGDGDYGSIPADEGNMRIAIWDGSVWTVASTVAMPEVEGTDTLEAELIPKGKAVKEYVDDNTVPLILGKNLFNTDNIKTGQYINNSGIVVENTSWAWSGLIDISSIPDGDYIYLSTDRDRNGAAFFPEGTTPSSASGRFVDGLTGAFQKLAGDRYFGFNLYSPANDDYTWAQVEHGAEATPYEPYVGKIIPSDKVEGLESAIQDAETALDLALDSEEKLSNLDFHVSISANILNPNNKVPDHAVGAGTGELSPSAIYNALDFTPVKPNTSYKAVKSDNSPFELRQVVFYNSSKVMVGAVTTASTTFTTPSNASLIRASIAKTQGELFNELAIVESSENYEPYYNSVDVRINRETPTESKEDNSIATIKDVNNIVAGNTGKSIKWSIDALGTLVLDYGGGNVISGDVANNRGYTGNNMFNFKTYNLYGVSSSNTDDVAPMHIFGTILGANHGFPRHYIATITAHGLDNTAIGKEFTKDGVKFYAMRIVDANRIAFLSENTGTATNWNFTALTAGTITLEGNDYTISSVQSSQLYPSLGVVNIDVIADDREVTLDSSGSADKVKVVETYNIYNVSSVLDNIKARAGQTSEPTFVGDTAVVVKNIYSFEGKLSCVVHTNVIFKQSIPLVDIMVNQAIKLAGSTVYYYVPNSNPLNASVDLRKPTAISWSSSIPGTFVTKANSPEPTNPPNRVIQYSGNLGFMIGYIPQYNNYGNTLSTFEIRNNTGKIYPHPVEGTAVGTTTSVNDTYDVKLYRVYTDLTKTRKDGRLSYFIVNDSGNTYIFVDYSASMFDEINIDLPHLNGRELEVVESKNATLISKSFNQGFIVDAEYVEGETCYIVLKITR